MTYLLSVMQTSTAVGLMREDRLCRANHRCVLGRTSTFSLEHRDCANHVQVQIQMPASYNGVRPLH